MGRVNHGGTATELLAAVVSDASLPLDRRSVATIEIGVVDAMGCIVAGSRAEVCRRAGLTVADCPPPTGRKVVGTADYAEPSSAAFLNATAGHALEFDDWEIAGNSHPSIVLVAAILASACGRLCGASMAAAYARGFEVIARVGEAINFEHYRRGWHATGTLGSMGAAAAAAAVMGLEPTTTAHAISLACSRSGGITAQFGSDAKALQAGFAAEAGVRAAMLAAHGLTDRLDVLESPNGYGTITAGVAPDRFEAPLSKLAAPWAVGEHGLGLKPHPTCGYTHRVVDAAIELRSQLEHAGIALGDIEVIEIALPEMHASILPFKQPASADEARFSLPFAAAVALVEGRITLGDFSSARWNDPTVSTLIERCRVEPFTPNRPELNYDAEEPDSVTVVTNAGRRFSASVAFPYGSPQRPMAKADVMAKAATLTGAGNRALSLLERWTDLDDIGLVVDAFDPPQVLERQLNHQTSLTEISPSPSVAGSNHGVLPSSRLNATVENAIFPYK